MNKLYKYDILPTGYDDPYEGELFRDDEYMPKTLHSISISDLMGTDYSIWIKQNAQFGFDVEIQNDEETYEIFKDNGLHPYAMEGFAEFCRRFLHSYSRFEDGEVA